MTPIIKALWNIRTLCNNPTTNQAERGSGLDATELTRYWVNTLPVKPDSLTKSNSQRSMQGTHSSAEVVHAQSHDNQVMALRLATPLLSSLKVYLTA